MKTNKYKREIEVPQHSVGNLIIYQKRKFRIRELKLKDGGRIPCNGLCAFGVMVSGQHTCTRPEGVEACTFVNRNDYKNIFFEEVFK